MLSGKLCSFVEWNTKSSTPTQYYHGYKLQSWVKTSSRASLEWFKYTRTCNDSIYLQIRNIPTQMHILKRLLLTIKVMGWWRMHEVGPAKHHWNNLPPRNRPLLLWYLRGISGKWRSCKDQLPMSFFCTLLPWIGHPGFLVENEKNGLLRQNMVFTPTELPLQ